MEQATLDMLLSTLTTESLTALAEPRKDDDSTTTALRQHAAVQLAARRARAADELHTAPGAQPGR